MVTISPTARSPRGSVMILVVAVLGLLAVLGTVYIVASRTQRASSAAMNADANFSLARQAILSACQQAIGDSMLDGNGSIGGITSAAGHVGSRNFDYPELGNAATGTTTYNGGLRNEPWLVAHLHNQSLAVNDLSLLTPAPFNPSTGTYSGIPNTLFPYTDALSTVVGDQTPNSMETTTEDPVPVPTIADAYINLLPFSDVTGVRYRYGVRIIDTNRMANLNTGATDDTLAKGDTLGQYLTSLRLCPAVADMDYTKDTYFNFGTTNSNGDGTPIGTFDAKALLQQSQPITAGLGRAGLSTTNATFSLASWQTQVLRIERPSDTLVALFDPTEELELRAYGSYGTSFHMRAANISATNSANFRLWPYTLSTASNAAGNFSPLGTTQIGNPRRRNYTTYSFSRQIRPYVDPKALPNPLPDYALTLTGGANDALWQTPPSGFSIDANNISQTWPTAHIQPININFPLSFASAATANDSMFYLAGTATNLATLMESACSPPPVVPQDAIANPANPNVFTHDETCAFAANSMTFRENGFTTDTAIASPPAGGAWMLPYGPSFVDDQGLCVRTASTIAGVTTLYGRDFGVSPDATKPGLKTGIPNRIYLGYAAQPFINEVAAQEGQDTSGATPVTVVKDVAIELYNPYATALSLRGYHLKVMPATGTTPLADIDLSGAWVPAKGFLVVTANGSPEFDGKVTEGPTTHKFSATNLAPSMLDPTGGNVVLYRPYFRRGNLTNSLTTADLAPVDQFNYLTLMDPNGLPKLTDTPATEDDSLQRSNSGTIYWGAEFNSVDVRKPATLGAQNSNTSVAGYPLYDRYATNSAITQGSTFTNINEFNQIMRVAHVFDITDPANPTPISLLEDKLLTLSASTAPYNNMQFPIDAQLHFDFLAAPYIYNTTPSTNPGTLPSTTNYKPGDIRAVHLLDQIALIDRVTDNSINLAAVGINGLDKLRLPGQININTASGDVIRALPAIQNITTVQNFTSGDVHQAVVANILNYRDRMAVLPGETRAKYPIASAGFTAATVDYSDSTQFPGKGFRSLAELLVVLKNPGATDLQSRDQDWAAAYNLCTVRSDTFIVYGYMEAVRANPAYTASTFDNASNWYGAVTDDPRDANIQNVPLLRIAQRRWVALIDRSFSNYDRGFGFVLPRVIATKDLPQ